MPILNMVYGKGGSTGGGGNVGEPTNLSVVSAGSTAYIKWTDNNLNSIPATTFQKSELVRKENSAPTSPSDGTLIETETVMNTYQNTSYEDTGLTVGTTYYYVVFSYSTDGAISYCNAVSVVPRPVWEPTANTIGYYPLDGDMLNHATTGKTFPNGDLGTAEFSTTRVHGNHINSLYCNGSTYAFLPANSEFVFGTSDFTISVWVYSETNTGTYTGFLSNYNDSFGGDAKQGYRISDRFGSQNKLNFCWNAGSGSTDIWVDGTTNTPIYNDGRHNVVLSRTNGVFNLYLDGNTAPVYTNNAQTTRGIGKNNTYYLGVNPSDSRYSKVYMNDLIFENRGWSAQDVADYYDMTV